MDVSERRARLERLITDESLEEAQIITGFESARRILSDPRVPASALEEWAAQRVWPELREALGNYATDAERLEAYRTIRGWSEALDELERAGGDVNNLPGGFEDLGDGAYSAGDSERYAAMLREELAKALDAVASHVIPMIAADAA